MQQTASGDKGTGMHQCKEGNTLDNMDNKDKVDVQGKVVVGRRYLEGVVNPKPLEAGRYSAL